MDIQQRIQRSLSEIEEKEHVRILHAVESGSRAWGFASPDSDYDVRFIYVRREEDYLTLEDQRDVIEWELNDVYDISGWDLKKALLLARKSNPTLFEWLGSPIVYRTTEDWQNMIPTLLSCYRMKTGIYHYYGTAVSTRKEHYRGDQIKLKAYFYILRPLLAAQWIREHQSPPPVLMEMMLDLLPEDVRRETERLVALKKSTPELGKGDFIPVLDEYVSREIPKLQELLQSLPTPDPADLAPLNALFLEQVRK